MLDETGGEQSIFRLVAALAVEAGDSGGAVVAYVGSRPSHFFRETIASTVASRLIISSSTTGLLCETKIPQQLQRKHFT